MFVNSVIGFSYYSGNEKLGNRIFAYISLFINKNIYSTPKSYEVLLIGVEGAQTPAGSSWSGETPQTPAAARRLSASLAESEAPGTEINSPHLTSNQNKDCRHHYFMECVYSLFYFF
jgi:hypothetical protein